MFYSHEVLTSRKYGVATVWLVATLGSKSSLKKINRKQILDVDVSKACQTIVDPVAPMALRLQSSLLYGVSRVYLQQCGYVLSDAQNAHTTMRMMLRTVKNLTLDTDAGKARPEQLVLKDDPSFLPDFAPPPIELLADLNLDLGLTRTEDSQSLTPFGTQHSSSSASGFLGGLILPSSSPSVVGDFGLPGDKGLTGSNVDDAGNSGGVDDVIVHLDEPDFTFDEDGNMVDLSPGNAATRTPMQKAAGAVQSDAAASARVRVEHKEGLMGGNGQHVGDRMNVEVPIISNDLPEGDIFPTPAQPSSSQEQSEVLHSTSTISAPMRKRARKTRVLPMDTAIELRNKDLADWNHNYLQNMAEAKRSKKKSQSFQQAKKHAEYYLFGAGIGGITSQYLLGNGSNPFERYTGDNLYELLTGKSRKKATGSKHDRDSGIDDATQEESRRVRQRTNSPTPGDEIGRGLVDNDGFPLHFGDMDDVELPREAPVPLDDAQLFSAMPWNISASMRGSSAVPRSIQTNTLGSADPYRPGSRMVSASPLLHRGRLSGLEALKSLTSDADLYGGDEFAMQEPSSDFPVPEGVVQNSVRVRDALSAEGENFLAFVAEAIDEKRDRVRDDFGTLPDLMVAAANNSVDFEDLLPPIQNSKVVACQGLVQVLALGTKGLLDVQQHKDFGMIHLKLTDKAKAAQAMDVSSDARPEDEDNQEEFMIADDQPTQEDEGDVDSLYAD